MTNSIVEKSPTDTNQSAHKFISTKILLFFSLRRTESPGSKQHELLRHVEEITAVRRHQSEELVSPCATTGMQGPRVISHLLAQLQAYACNETRRSWGVTPHGPSTSWPFGP